MTHTLHRRGEKEELLQDFPMLALVAQRFNEQGARPKLQRIAEIMLKHSDINFGDCRVNKFTTPVEEIKDNLSVVAHVVFRDKESLTACMRELKEADQGISVIVSGCFEAVEECCQKAGIKPHLTEFSLGVHGRTELLPEEPVLEILTMCGHAMVAKNQVTHLLERIRKGKITPEEAGQELAKPCVCGIFNPERAARLLGRLAGV